MRWPEKLRRHLIWLFTFVGIYSSGFHGLRGLHDLFPNETLHRLTWLSLIPFVLIAGWAGWGIWRRLHNGDYWLD